MGISSGYFSTLIDASEYGSDHDRINPEVVKISLYKITKAALRP